MWTPLSSRTSPTGRRRTTTTTLATATAAVVFVLVLADRPAVVNGQFFNALRNLFRPVENIFRPVANIFGGGGRFTDDGTQSPQSTGKDELFPRDCGRDTNKGTGKLCFPDGLLCQDSKF